jgi:hypothetical protein
MDPGLPGNEWGWVTAQAHLSTATFMWMIIRRTKKVDWSGNASDLYSGDVWFDSRLGYRLSWLPVFVFFSSPSRNMPGYLETGHCLFIPQSYNIKLQHPVALHRSHFALPFFAVCVQCRLIFYRRVFLIVTACFGLTGHHHQVYRLLWWRALLLTVMLFCFLK